MENPTTTRARTSAVESQIIKIGSDSPVMHENTGAAGGGGGSGSDSASKWGSYALWTLPFLAGVALPSTGAFNAQSAAVLGSSYWAVATTYTIATILCVSWALFTGKKKTKREGFRDLKIFVQSGMWNWCCLLGGVLGAAQNIISAEASPVLGTGLMTTGILLGQVIMSMICDATGCAWAKKIGVHYFTVIGGLIVCCGCVLYRFALFLDGLDDGGAPVGKKLVFILFALLYGIINCLQAGVGGQMGRQIGHFRRASAWAFTSGMVLSYIIASIENPSPGHADVEASDWWKFCAAPVSMFYSGVAAIVPAYLTFSAVFACIVAGQLVGSTILDANGWLGLFKRDLDLYNLFGILVVMAGVVFVNWGRRKQIAALQASELPECDVEAHMHTEVSPQNGPELEATAGRDVASGIEDNDRSQITPTYNLSTDQPSSFAAADRHN